MRYCHHCDAKVDATADECDECGRDLRESTPPASTSAATGANRSAMAAIGDRDPLGAVRSRVDSAAGWLRSLRE